MPGPFAPFSRTTKPIVSADFHVATLALSTSLGHSVPQDTDVCSQLGHEPLKRQFVNRLGGWACPDVDPRRGVSQ